MASTTRRQLIGAGLALPALVAGTAHAAGTINVVLESEVVILDPHATTAAITRTFATHVFDTLFAMDGQGMIRPQMVEAWETSADGLTWNFRLRDGLQWHDGTPVTAQDCVASLERWAPRDALGRMLWAADGGTDGNRRAQLPPGAEAAPSRWCWTCWASPMRRCR